MHGNRVFVYPIDEICVAPSCERRRTVNMRHEVAYQVAERSRKEKNLSLTGGLDSCPCLVLNADYQPLSYLPLRWVTWSLSLALEIGNSVWHGDIM